MFSSWQIFQLILQLFKNQEEDLHRRVLTGKMKLEFFYSWTASALAIRLRILPRNF